MQMDALTEAELRFMLDIVSVIWVCNLNILIHF